MTKNLNNALDLITALTAMSELPLHQLLLVAVLCWINKRDHGSRDR
jgi:hypothetical protein